MITIRQTYLPTRIRFDTIVSDHINKYLKPIPLMLCSVYGIQNILQEMIIQIIEVLSMPSFISTQLGTLQNYITRLYIDHIIIHKYNSVNDRTITTPGITTNTIYVSYQSCK